MGTLDEALTALRSAVLEVVEAAQRDDKTPLLNQSALRRFGEEFVAGGAGDDRTWRYVVYGDVNDFKAFNTRHTHDVADLALHAIGGELSSVAELCRGVAFRRSGDEFVLLVPSASELSDTKAALASAFAAFEVTLPDGQITAVSLSFGAAESTEDCSFEALLARAEQASEVAKRSGPGTLVEWSEAIGLEASVGYRCRCAMCKTSVSLAIPPDRVRDDGYPCPVCSAVLSA